MNFSLKFKLRCVARFSNIFSRLPFAREWEFCEYISLLLARPGTDKYWLARRIVEALTLTHTLNQRRNQSGAIKQNKPHPVHSLLSTLDACAKQQLMVEINSDRRREKRQPSQQKRAESRVKNNTNGKKSHTRARMEIETRPIYDSLLELIWEEE